MSEPKILDLSLNLKKGTEHFFSFCFLATILAVNALVLKKVMLYGFDPNDFGGLIDVAWRMMHGQRIYVDFYYHAVPIYNATFALFFKVFGFGKLAIWLYLVFLSSAGTILTFLMTYRRIPLGLCLLVTFLAAAGFHWARSFPHYDTFVSLWGIAGLCLFVRQSPFQSARQTYWVSVCMGVFAVCAVLTKLTDGGAFGLIFLAALLIQPRFRLQAFAGYAAGCFLTFAVFVLLIASPKQFFLQTFVYYSARQVERFVNFLQWENWTTHFYWLPAVLMLVAAVLFPQIRKQPVGILLVMGTALAAIFSYNTGSEKNPAHMPLMGTLIGLGLSFHDALPLFFEVIALYI